MPELIEEINEIENSPIDDPETNNVNPADNLCADDSDYVPHKDCDKVSFIARIFIFFVL